MPTGTLSGKGKALFEKVYNESLKGDCDKECAARKAWSAVKSAGWRKDSNGNWTKESSAIVEFSMAITKASIPDKASRTMRLSMVNSDTGEDVFEERTSTELFEDFVERIDANSPVPKPFDAVIEDGWNGGMPYLSISHYRSGSGKNVPGEPEKIYVDGERLKSSAVLYDNPLGLAVWKAVCSDMEERNRPLEERTHRNPVRISIGFLDLQHKHEIDGEDDYIFTRSEIGQKCKKCEEGINGKVYLKGQLVHLAFTRVPANPRTQVEVFKMGDEIETKKQDAESIIGDLAEELVGKSAIEDDVLVVKADESRDESEETENITETEEVSDEPEVIMDEEKEVQEEPVVEEAQVDEEKEKEDEEDEDEEEELSELDKSALDVVAKVKELAAKGKYGEDALKEVQPLFNALGETVKKSVAAPAGAIDEDALAERVAAKVMEALPALIAKAVPAAPEKAEQPINQFIPRSLTGVTHQAKLVNPEGQKKLTQIERIARERTGLPVD